MQEPFWTPLLAADETPAVGSRIFSLRPWLSSLPDGIRGSRSTVRPPPSHGIFPYGEALITSTDSHFADRVISLRVAPFKRDCHTPHSNAIVVVRAQPEPTQPQPTLLTNSALPGINLDGKA